MAQETSPGNKLQNIIIAIAAVGLAIALFFGLRLQNADASLAAQAQAATPIEVALANGKPTLMEFYADWCGSCQAMSGSLASIKQDYGDRVNFAMLNVDNTKWLPEIEKYRVDGIPHFVYFNRQGETLGQAIGEQPEGLLRSSLDEILADRIQAIEQTPGQTSKMSPAADTVKSSDPRSHGAQVKTS
jgi:thioredoxin-like negative regulator of GroEL